MTPTQQENSLISDLKSNWMIVLFIGGLIVGWTNLSNRIMANEVLAQENKTTLEVITQIQIDLTKIQKDVEYIKLKLK